MEVGGSLFRGLGVQGFTVSGFRVLRIRGLGLRGALRRVLFQARLPSFEPFLAKSSRFFEGPIRVSFQVLLVVL